MEGNSRQPGEFTHNLSHSYMVGIRALIVLRRVKQQRLVELSSTVLSPCSQNSQKRKWLPWWGGKRTNRGGKAAGVGLKPPGWSLNSRQGPGEPCLSWERSDPG